jgi:hypothetical protein
VGSLAFLAVGMGAAFGAWLRWGLGLWLNPIFPSVPFGTLAANLTGGYLIGVAIAFFAQHPGLPPEWRFQPGDAASLGATLVRFLSQGRPRPSADLVGRVRSTMSLPCFRDSFSSTVLGLVPGRERSLLAR